jgi:uncharacterized protein YidB (DUF937 family)
MDLLKLGAELFTRSVAQSGGANLSVATVLPALQSLLAGPDGKFDIAGLVSRFSSGGLQNLVGSWLGDGANQKLPVEDILKVLGGSNVGDFAAKLGLSAPVAASGLADALPQMIDKASAGGNLLSGDALGKALGSLGGLFGR